MKTHRNKHVPNLRFNLPSPRLRLPRSLLVLASGTFLTPFAVAEETWRDWEILREHHTDVHIGYNDVSGEWAVHLEHEEAHDEHELHAAELLEPTSSILLVTATALREVPANVPDEFSFIGEPGDPYYLLPAQEQPEVLHIGFSAHGVEPGLFEGSFGGSVSIEMTDYSGPRETFLYQAESGSATIFMDTRSPNPPYGSHDVTAMGHSHMNWVFQKPGIHILHMTPRGTLASDGATVAGDPVPLFFLVDPEPVDWWLLDSFGVDANGEIASLSPESPYRRANLLAYALGYSPFESATPYLPEVGVVEMENQEHLSLSFRSPGGDPDRADRSDLRYTVQVSGNLSDWTDLTSAPSPIEPAPDGTPRLRVVDPTPLDDSAHRFIRLKIDLVHDE